MMKNYFNAFIVIHLFLVACACEDPHDQDPKGVFSPKSEGVFDATFTEQTVYFDQNERSDIVLEDEEEGTYRLKKTSTKANVLKKDSILLIHGVALRKVVELRDADDEIIIETDYARLDELIEDGTIEWTSYLDINTETPVQFQIGSQIYQADWQSENITRFETDIGDYKCEITMTLKKDSVNIELSLSKKIGYTTVAKFTAEGIISGLSSSNKLEYKKSKLTNFSSQNKQEGELTLSLAMAASENERTLIEQELPFVLMTIPYMVGPIPVFIKLKLMLVINLLAPSLGSAQASIHFKYDSETGLKYEGAKVSASGAVGNYSIDKNKAEVGAPSPIAVNYGIGFPRLEIGVFDEVIVPWAQTAFLFGTDFTPFFPTCRQARAAFMGSIGYNFEFLGIKLSNTQNIWDEKKFFEKTSTCPPD